MLQPTSTELAAEADVNPACSDSAALAEISGLDSELAMLVRATELASAKDLACGEPEDLQRQCRALFFLSSTEPVVVWASGGDWRASLAVWEFAAVDGQASSPPDLAMMWARLNRFVDGLGDDLATGNDAAVADRLIGAGDAADDLTVLESVCEAS
ncbi:MAG: hypothetical protein R2706_00345 [Acidimicrobiales bacterium]